MFSKYFEQFLDSFKDAVCITDRAGIVVYLNNRHSELTGISRESLLGKSAVEMMKHGLFDVVINPEIVKTKQSHSSIQNAGGRKLILEGTPILDESGEVAFVSDYRLGKRELFVPVPIAEGKIVVDLEKGSVLPGGAEKTDGFKVVFDNDDCAKMYFIGSEEQWRAL